MFVLFNYLFVIIKKKKQTVDNNWINNIRIFSISEKHIFCRKQNSLCFYYFYNCRWRLFILHINIYGNCVCAFKPEFLTS
jgi:hypothetical protein